MLLVVALEADAKYDVSASGNDVVLTLGDLRTSAGPQASGLGPQNQASGLGPQASGTEKTTNGHANGHANGHGPAQKKLGDIYGSGHGDVQRDYETSLRWYQRAREQGIEIPQPFSYPGVRR